MDHELVLTTKEYMRQVIDREDIWGWSGAPKAILKAIPRRSEKKRKNNRKKQKERVQMDLNQFGPLANLEASLQAFTEALR